MTEIWGDDMRMLQFRDLADRKGIGYSRTHIDRLEAAGQFPKRVKLGEGRYAAVAWVEDEVDAFLRERIAERDRERATA